MLRSLLAALAAALAVAPAALADGGPSPGVLAGGSGVLSAADEVRYLTFPAGSRTALTAVSTADGSVGSWIELRGGWGVPIVAYDGTTGGLSANGKTLVLAESGFRTRTRFQVIDATKLRRLQPVALAGGFAFDALSPDGRRLYLIHHVSATNANRYTVRAYDLVNRRLLPGTIADRTQRGWVMQGSPMARATSPDGRFVYTLYQNFGGYPFVHALDTVRGVAHCVGLPFTGDQAVLAKLALGGRVLAVRSQAGETLFRIDTRTYRLTDPGRFPWWTLGAPGLLAPVLGLLLWRRQRRTSPATSSRRLRSAFFASRRSSSSASIPASRISDAT
jgi:hypothetical protein